MGQPAQRRGPDPALPTSSQPAGEMVPEAQIKDLYRNPEGQQLPCPFWG